jgi:type VI protein secretion system component Hcp
MKLIWDWLKRLLLVNEKIAIFVRLMIFSEYIEKANPILYDYLHESEALKCMLTWDCQKCI